ncbi:MAG: formate--tetrahydrofolate ligase [Candidatus Omnitrophota bacterium]
MGRILPIEKIAAKFGIKKHELKLFGNYIAKVDISILKRLDNPSRNKNSKYILVTGITPTPLGEGKTVTTLGLSMSLNRLGKKSFACIRQPSLGPLFGIKGASGGGKCQIIPLDDFCFNFLGDFTAIELAHNLCASFIDNSLYRNNPLNIDCQKIFLRRVSDLIDRSLRNIKIETKNYSYQSGFELTPSSELMAIMALVNSRKELHDSLDDIIVAQNKNGKFIKSKELKVTGAMAALLKYTILPNLIQTKENTPCFAHTGPFANIAHGNSSIIADKIALKLSNYVVTEAGFGADCGAEKFFNIKCRYSGLIPNAVVLVCTVRALKLHSNRFRDYNDDRLLKEDLIALEEGCVNLEKQIENIKIFGLPAIVVINKFDQDSDKEIALIKNKAKDFGAFDCIVSTMYNHGSLGGVNLAKAVIKAVNQKNEFKFLYSLDSSIEDKMRKIATKIYGAKDIEISDEAFKKILLYKREGFDKLPICMAKTQFSLSHNPILKGRPKDFIIPIKDLHINSGARFITAILGDILTMPGLPKNPQAEKIDIDDNGTIQGLS